MYGGQSFRQRGRPARSGRGARLKVIEERALLPDVARAMTTSHPSDRAFEIGPSIGVLRLHETVTQARRVVQAFLEPVRQFIDPVDRAVAQFVIAHSGSRGKSQNTALPRTGLFKTEQVGETANSCRIVNRSHWPRCLAPAPGLSYPSTSTSLVAAEEPFKKTSSVYFPAGHPSGFEMWNSVLASPVGAIVCVDSLTTCPSW
jgi:hypothetical protein